MGEAVPPPTPEVRLSPSSLTFGLVAMFQTEEAMATIFNDGAGILTLQPPVQTGDTVAFEVVPPLADWPGTLGKNASFSFTVKFHAGATAGTKNGSLSVQTNDGVVALPFSGYTTP
jgi:hypothetical protein